MGGGEERRGIRARGVGASHIIMRGGYGSAKCKIEFPGKTSRVGGVGGGGVYGREDRV